jgi:hypothetical protein
MMTMKAKELLKLSLAEITTRVVEMLHVIGDDPRETARWRDLCKRDRLMATQFLLIAGLIEKTDLPDGSAFLDYMHPEHPALAIWLEQSHDPSTRRLAGMKRQQVS